MSTTINLSEACRRAGIPFGKLKNNLQFQQILSLVSANRSGSISACLPPPDQNGDIWVPHPVAVVAAMLFPAMETEETPLEPPPLTCEAQPASISTDQPVIFDFKDQPVRILNRPDGPWFVATDVCRVLEIANPRDAVSDLDDDEKGVGTTDTLGGAQKTNIISESGLYALIFKSRKAQARVFRKWVASEVLPAIRQTGRYEVAPPPQESSPHIRHLAAERNVDRLLDVNYLLMEALEGISPKVRRLESEISHWRRLGPPTKRLPKKILDMSTRFWADVLELLLARRINHEHFRILPERNILLVARTHIVEDYYRATGKEMNLTLLFKGSRDWRVPMTANAGHAWKIFLGYSRYAWAFDLARFPLAQEFTKAIAANPPPVTYRGRPRINRLPKSRKEAK